jgi:hypothetical protein
MRYIIGLGLILTVVSTYIFCADDGTEPKLKASDTLPVVVPAVWEEVTEQDARAGVNESRGNWFFKAQILKKAINPVKDVQRVVKEVLPFQKAFEGRHQALKAELAAFYQEYGFQDADVATQLAIITDDIKHNEQLMQQPAPRVVQQIDPKTGKRIPPPPPGPRPAEEIQRLKTSQLDIEKLSQKMDRLRKLEAAAEEAIRKLIPTIEKARESEKQAWRDYEKIADTLSDVVAEDMYRSIEAALANVKNIKQYCAETLETFFTGLVQEVNTIEAELKTEIDVLRLRGYAFGKRATEQLAADRATAEAERIKALQAVKKPEPVLSWWGTFVGYLSSAWHAVINALKSVLRAISGLFGR